MAGGSHDHSHDSPDRIAAPFTPAPGAIVNVASLFFGERSLTTVATAFDSRESAQAAALNIADVARLDPQQVALVAPHDPQLGEKVGPEDGGILRTLVRAHVTCGAAGVVLGLLAFAALYGMHTTAVRTTPVMSLVAMVVFGLFFGLMAGGALALRPDHEGVLAAVQDASQRGEWSVVFHPGSRSALSRVLLALGRRPFVRTL